MALHLIIDGYNLIRQSPELSEVEGRDLAAGRQALLARLAEYRLSRPGHKITVVFDGREAGGLQESRGREQGLSIIYSRRGEAADEVIKRLLVRERARAVVVSSDRELQDWAARVGATWIAAPHFQRRHLQFREPAAPGEAGAAFLAASAKKGPARRLPKRLRRQQQRLRKL